MISGGRLIDRQFIPDPEPRERIPRYETKHWMVPLELVYECEIYHLISEEEFLLLARIESLVKHGRGCFARNEWFAERSRKSVRRIQQLLSGLKERGYIKVKMKKGQRYLYTKWSPRKSLKKKRKKTTK